MMLVVFTVGLVSCVFGNVAQDRRSNYLDSMLSSSKLANVEPKSLLDLSGIYRSHVPDYSDEDSSRYVPNVEMNYGDPNISPSVLIQQRNLLGYPGEKQMSRQQILSYVTDRDSTPKRLLGYLGENPTSKKVFNLRNNNQLNGNLAQIRNYERGYGNERVTSMDQSEDSLINRFARGYLSTQVNPLDQSEYSQMRQLRTGYTNSIVNPMDQSRNPQNNQISRGYLNMRVSPLDQLENSQTNQLTRAWLSDNIQTDQKLPSIIRELNFSTIGSNLTPTSRTQDTIMGTTDTSTISGTPKLSKFLREMIEKNLSDVTEESTEDSDEYSN